MRRAVFLDRDGVLNRAFVKNGKPYPPPNPDALEILPGVEEACRLLREAGFILVVVTNQPDVARGTTKREVVEEINRTLQSLLHLDDIRVCYHDDSDRCACRKPSPGLILDAARDWAVDPAQSFLVGDRWKDIAAGNAAGCRTIFIDYGYAERAACRSHFQAASLADATRHILSFR